MGRLGGALIKDTLQASFLCQNIWSRKTKKRCYRTFCKVWYCVLLAQVENRYMLLWGGEMGTMRGGRRRIKGLLSSYAGLSSDNWQGGILIGEKQKCRFPVRIWGGKNAYWPDISWHSSVLPSFFHKRSGGWEESRGLIKCVFVQSRGNQNPSFQLILEIKILFSVFLIFFKKKCIVPNNWTNNELHWKLK